MEHILNSISSTPTVSSSLVLSYRDGLVIFNPFDGAMSGELFLVRDPADPALVGPGLLMTLKPSYCEGLILVEDLPVKEGWVVSRIGFGRLSTVRCGLSITSSIFDSLGNVKFGLSFDPESALLFTERSTESRAPNILDRKSVHQPLMTGLKAVDALIPIGLGQRELIIGDRQTGKTTIGVDLWQNQSSLNGFLNSVFGFNQRFSLSAIQSMVYVIYVAIGQKRSKVISVYKEAFERGMLDFGCIVAATASESAAMQFLAPYTACSFGEYIRDVVSGHAVLLYDDLSKHAIAYRQMSLLLRRPPGREAFPGDVFYIHSRLLERAAKLSDEFGGGSLTALPIIETQAGDVSAYIPTNVISITDGQIFLETDLFYAGIRPAINAGLSVSRVGSAAQTAAMKQIAGSLKLELAQFREVEGFAKLGAALDIATQRLINRGLVLVELLKQRQAAPLFLLFQLFYLFAGVSGYLDRVSISNIEVYLTSIEELLLRSCFWLFFERSTAALSLFCDLCVLNTLFLGSLIVLCHLSN